MDSLEQLRVLHNALARQANGFMAGWGQVPAWLVAEIDWTTAEIDRETRGS